MADLTKNKISNIASLAKENIDVNKLREKVSQAGDAISDRPEKTVFIITTDGMENASKTYTYNKVQSMIKHQIQKHGWEFLFLGANIDAKAEARRFGIDEKRAVKYHSDKKGTALNYKVVGEAIAEFRCCSAISDDWAEEIEEDFEERS